MSSMDLTWNAEPEKFTGDIGAAVNVSREGWERSGARFSEIDDELGGSAWIAAGSIDTPAGETEFGVLDYSAETTYLLAPATGEENRTLTTAIAEALVEAEVLSADDVLPEHSPFEEEDLAQRVAVLEQLIGEAAAEAASTAIPVAVDVEVPERYPQAPPRGTMPRVQIVGSPMHLNRHVGTIKSLNRDKGFGVIRPEGGGREILLKFTNLSPKLKLLDIGKKVTFRYGIEPLWPDAPECEGDEQQLFFFTRPVDKP